MTVKSSGHRSLYGETVLVGTEILGHMVMRVITVCLCPSSTTNDITIAIAKETNWKSVPLFPAERTVISKYWAREGRSCSRVIYVEWT